MLLSVGLAAQSENSASTQGGADCATYAVKNESTGVKSAVRLCFAGTGVSVRNLKNSKPEPNQTGHQNKQYLKQLGEPFEAFKDLHAQISMAHSTNLIKWYTLSGVIIGGLGIVLLAWTLSETRKTAVAATRAADAAESAERAHVVVELLPQFAEDPAGAIDKSAFNIEPRIVNYGKTPAEVVEVKLSSYWPWKGADVERCQSDFSVFGHPPTARHWGGGFLGADSKHILISINGFKTADYCGMLEDQPGSAPALRFWVHVEYRDIFQRTYVAQSTVSITPIGDIGLGDEYRPSAKVMRVSGIGVTASRTETRKADDQCANQT